MNKHVNATYEETWLDYEELEQSLRKLEGDNSEENVDSIMATGKRTFGPVNRAHEEAKKRPKLGDADKNSDTEYESHSGKHFGSSEVDKKAEYAINKADDVQLWTALIYNEQQDLFTVRCSNLYTLVVWFLL
jgi:U3 small nucleolar RNA-associated protein 14